MASLTAEVAGIVQAPTHVFLLTNLSLVSEILGHCLSKPKGKAVG